MNQCRDWGYPSTTVGGYPYFDLLCTETYVKRHYPDAEIVDIDPKTHSLIWVALEKEYRTTLSRFWSPGPGRDPAPNPLEAEVTAWLQVEGIRVALEWAWPRRRKRKCYRMSQFYDNRMGATDDEPKKRRKKVKQPAPKTPEPTDTEKARIRNLM